MIRVEIEQVFGPCMYRGSVNLYLAFCYYNNPSYLKARKNSLKSDIPADLSVFVFGPNNF